MQIFTVVVVTVVGVGRSHHVRDAVGRRDAAHGNANIPRLGPVIYLGKNVRMNINHNMGTPVRPRCRVTSDLSRFVRKGEGSEMDFLPDRWHRTGFADFPIGGQQGDIVD